MKERSYMQKIGAKLSALAFLGVIFLGINPHNAEAKSVDYEDSEVAVHVTPGEPTQIQFPSPIDGGFMKKSSALSLQPKESDLIVFAKDNISESGEAIIVRLKNGRSYSLRISKATTDKPRDDHVTINDSRGSIMGTEEEEPEYKERKFEYAPPSQVSGMMREMVLAAEFGKASIAGYRATDAYRGQTVFNDGTMVATVDKIFMGTNLWGYVIDVKNLLDQTQKVNPAAFRIDGTRAVSAKNWELAPVPLTIENQIAAAHTTKVYIVTKARK